VTGETAVAAIRPDDLVPVAADAHGIDAAVEAIEYRGRDFFGSARASGGEELFFRADRRVAPGEAIRLGAEPRSVLVYPGE